MPKIMRSVNLVLQGQEAKNKHAGLDKVSEGSHLPHILALPNPVLPFAFALGVMLLLTIWGSGNNGDRF